MKTITDNLYHAILPKPSLSSFIQPQRNSIESLSTYYSSEEFLTSHVYPYSAKELVKQIYDFPSWDYNYMLYIATSNDALFLKAAFEIASRYPWYPFAYIARNIWHLLYDPGFEHDRYTLASMRRSNIRDAFPFDASTNDSANLSNRGIREINFDLPSNKFHFVHPMTDKIKKFFCNYYLKYTKILFYCMTIAWLATLLHLINRLIPLKRFQFILELLPKKLIPLVIILSLYLFLSMFIISLFVDPLLRLHNHLIPVKIMLAGLGAGVMLRIIQRLPLPWLPFQRSRSSKVLIDQSDLHLEQKHTTGIILLVLMIILLFVSWASYIWLNT
jgi:hypothetical protein